MGCDDSFLGIPSWHKGLTDADCNIQLDSVMDIWHIVLNIADMLLRLSIYFAIGFIIYGGVQFVISQGSPDKVAAAKKTILNAVIGLVLSIMATAIVGYIGGLF